MNTLYPVFLKPERLKFLIVGGGEVAAEKLQFLIKSSPQSQVTVVGTFFKQVLLDVEGENVKKIERSFHENDLGGHDIILAATNNRATNIIIRKLAKAKGKLVNVADTPDLCDFYLGGIVTKGEVKIAISTNGKSPTLAKRIREFLENMLPDSIDDLAKNLHLYRKTLKLDFDNKVSHLNKLTKSMLTHEEASNS